MRHKQEVSNTSTRKAEPCSATCRTGILGAGTCLRSGMQVSSYFTPSSNGERSYRNWLLWSKYIVSSKPKCWDFPVVKILPSNAGGVGLIPGQGAKIPHASQPKNQNVRGKKKKQEQRA
ncbi:unnamed protein product [Rangifer tarandus platyrhynchus]|uniref:Uncharacterized protein n=2 Tax=Rangifer tarandus platyrhynchus TaxID=3082113 RepID=A0ABN8ZWW9_RANTA|nr:unnamed protein product [Rangifer tarandus platyrhynchus]